METAPFRRKEPSLSCGTSPVAGVESRSQVAASADDSSRRNAGAKPHGPRKLAFRRNARNPGGSAKLA